MTPNAGSPHLGGRAEHEGTKGYSPDDRPLRDGHNPEPDEPTVEDAFEEAEEDEENAFEAAEETDGLSLQPGVDSEHS